MRSDSHLQESLAADMGVEVEESGSLPAVDEPAAAADAAAAGLDFEDSQVLSALSPNRDTFRN